MSAWVLMGVAAASAQGAPIPAAGNLPDDFYAKSGCARPESIPLTKPPRSDQGAVDAYNKKVRRYNEEAKPFGACINAYVDKAYDDIDWIVFAVNAAVAKANGSNPPPAPTTPGNMPAGFYPAPLCIAPTEKVDAAPDPRSAKAMEAHNTKVRTFNSLAGSFGDCIAGYKMRAQADIARIEDARNAAALEAKNR